MVNNLFAVLFLLLIQSIGDQEREVKDTINKKMLCCLYKPVKFVCIKLTVVVKIYKIQILVWIVNSVLHTIICQQKFNTPITIFGFYVYVYICILLILPLVALIFYVIIYPQKRKRKRKRYQCYYVIIIRYKLTLTITMFNY